MLRLTLSVSLIILSLWLPAQSSTMITLGPTVNYNPNFGLNKVLKDFNDLPGTTEKFKVRSFSIGASGSVETIFGDRDNGFSFSWLSFHYESTRNEGAWADSNYIREFDYYRVFTAFGVLNTTFYANGIYFKLEPLCFGRQKMRLKRQETQIFANNFQPPLETLKAIWTTTLLPQWTPSAGIGYDNGGIRIGLAARTTVPRTPASLPGMLGLDPANYSSRIGYFSLALEVMLSLGGN